MEPPEERSTRVPRADVPAPPTAAGGVEGRLEAALGALRRSGSVIVTATVLAVAVTAVVLLAEPQRHRARALIRLVEPSVEVGWTPEPAGGWGGTDPILSRTLLLQSPAVLDAAAGRAGLRLVDASTGLPPSWLSAVEVDLPPAAEGRLPLRIDDSTVTATDGGVHVVAARGSPIAVGGVRFVVDAAAPSGAVTLEVRSRQQTVEWLQDRLTVVPRPHTDGVAVVFEAPEPAVAMRVVNGIVLSYQSVDVEEARRRAALRRVLLEERIAMQDSLLWEAQVALGRLGRAPAPAAPTGREDTGPGGERRSLAEARASRQVRTMERLSDRLWEEYHAATLAEASRGPGVEVVALAERAWAVPRHRSLKLLIGAAAGLLLGGGIGLFRARLDRSILRREDVETFLSIPILAVIPRSVRTSARMGLAFRGLRRIRANGHDGNGGGAGHHGVGGAGRAHAAVSEASPVGSGEGLLLDRQGLEAYRTLRTNLIFRQRSASPRCLLVTSAATGEGKTTTVANLGFVVAQQSLRVLLVDADLRHPCLAEGFGLPCRPGLSEVLLGEVDLRMAVRRSGIRDLHLLPAGGSAANPSELLGGRRMERLMEELRGGYDLLLVDSPPVLEWSDATVLGTLVDGVILIVRAGAVHRGALRYTVEQLTAVGARVVGGVLNDPDGRERQGGYQRYGGAPGARIRRRRGRTTWIRRARSA